MLNRLLFLLSAVFILLAPTVKAQDEERKLIFHPEHTFSDFPATNEFPSSGTVKVNLASHRDGKQYRTAFSHIDLASADKFAGHYVIVGWGCGSSCQHFDLVDVKTGKIYGGLTASSGWKVVPNSNLLILDPPEEDGSYLPDCASCGQPALYAWKNNKFELLQKTFFTDADYADVAKKIMSLIKKGDAASLAEYIPQKLRSCEEKPMFSIPETREDLLNSLKLAKGDKLFYDKNDHTIDVSSSNGHADTYLTLLFDDGKVTISCVKYMQVE